MVRPFHWPRAHAQASPCQGLVFLGKIPYCHVASLHPVTQTKKQLLEGNLLPAFIQQTILQTSVFSDLAFEGQWGCRWPCLQKVCIKTRLSSSLLSFIGQVTKNTTVKWPITWLLLITIFSYYKSTFFFALVFFHGYSDLYMYSFNPNHLEWSNSIYLHCSEVQKYISPQNRLLKLEISLISDFALKNGYMTKSKFRILSRSSGRDGPTVSHSVL